jgi:hypothetical protein
MPDAAPFIEVLNALSYKSFAAYRVADRGMLKLPMDESWEQIKSPADSGAAIAISSRAANMFLLLVTPIPLPAGKKLGDDEVRAGVDKAAAQMKFHSLEKTLPLVSVTGQDARGYMFHATDPAPDPGEYRLLYQGSAAIETLLVTFTVLYNDDAEQDAKSALASIRDMRFVAANK